jgi:hypothetical protein
MGTNTNAPERIESQPVAGSTSETVPQIGADIFTSASIADFRSGGRDKSATSTTDLIITDFMSALKDADKSSKLAAETADSLKSGSDTNQKTAPETFLVNATEKETLDQQMKRHLGEDVYNHLTNGDGDWDWLIAHKDKLSEGIINAGRDPSVNFYDFVKGMQDKCKHILFEDNPRKASRPAGAQGDYTDTASADWLVKLQRGFLISNDQLANYIQWQDYTTSVNR